jgi:Clostripain family
MPNPTKKSWTFMIYMAGDNNLDANGLQDLKEMKRVGTTADLNVVAQFDSDSDAHRTKRYLLTKGSDLARDVVGTLGTTNTGDPKNLVDFATWAITNYPAQRYAMVLWNHGQGWDDTDIYAGERHRSLRRVGSGRVRHALFHKPVRQLLQGATRNPMITRAILLDDNAKDFLDNLEMKEVVKAVHKKLRRKLDLLGMDACLMSMPEVGYQMRDHVAFTVGSEETEPLDGWPYTDILGKLAKAPNMTPDALGKVVVNEYLASYRGGSDAVTQSLSDLGQSTRLAAAVKALAASLKTALRDPAARSAVRDARDRVQTYEVPDNVDLADLCVLIKGGAVPAKVKAACDGVLAALKNYVVSSGYIGGKMRNSKGASIYFPTGSISPLYAGLDFVKKTGWGRFLKAYLNALRSR